MVDNLEQILDFLKLTPDQAQDFFNKLKSSAESATPAFTKAANGIQGITNAIIEQTPEAIEKFKNITQSVNLFLSAISGGQEELSGMVSASAAIFTAWRSQLAPDAFNAINSSARGFNTNLVEVSKNLEKITKVLPDIAAGPLGSLANLGSKYAAIAQPARDLESAMLATASASGELGDLLKEVGSDMSGLTEKTVDYTNIMADAADRTHRSITDVGAYAAELMKIPGALSTTIDLTSDGKEQMSLLSAAMTVASGTGQNFQEVFKTLNQQYLQFGNAGKTPEEAFKGTLEYISRLSAASQALKMPLEFVRDYANQTAEAFKFFGNNSNAAINILGRFAPALKEVGLGPEAIKQLTQDITKNISQFGAAQQAFISSSSGGVGGLQGSAQIDLLKKQGKLDEVYKMTEQSLRKQFGGNVVSTEEAARSGTAAAQREREIQLITTGPTKLTSDRGEAVAILDAMSKGLSDALPKNLSKNPEAALHEAVDRGTSVQERQYSVLTTLNNLAEKEVLFAAISANNLTRLLTGRDSPLVKRFVDDEHSAAAGRDATSKLIKGNKADAQSPKTLNEAYKDHYNNIEKMGSSAARSVEQGLTDIFTRKQMLQKANAENAKKPDDDNKKNQYQGLPGTEHLPGKLFFNNPTRPTGARERVNNDIPAPGILGANGQRNVPGGVLGNQINKAIIEIKTSCPDCNKKMAKAAAVEVVDGKITDVQKTQVNHAYGTYSL